MHKKSSTLANKQGIGEGCSIDDTKIFSLAMSWLGLSIDWVWSRRIKMISLLTRAYQRAKSVALWSDLVISSRIWPRVFFRDGSDFGQRYWFEPTPINITCLKSWFGLHRWRFGSSNQVACDTMRSSLVVLESNVFMQIVTITGCVW